LWGKGTVYDCEPLELNELKALVTESGLRGEIVSVKAFRAWMDIESPSGWLARGVARVPDRWLEYLKGAIPTHVCLLHK